MLMWYTDYAIFRQNFNPDHVAGYFFDTHPSERQYELQQWVASVDPTGLYAQYMVNRSTYERNKEAMKYLGLKFEDFKYPWLAGLATSQASVYAPATQFVSKNVHRLYR